MGSTVVARYPFAGKNQLMILAEEVTTAGVPVFGTSRTTMPSDTTSTPTGAAVWKNVGYVTGGSTSETRTFEEISSIGHRNVQQLAEIKFEPAGSANMEYQTARVFYYTIASSKATATNSGIAHSDNVGSVTGLNRHIIYEPELNSGAWAADAIADTPSFNLLDGYTRAGATQPKVARKYIGCKVDTLNINFTRDGSVKIDMNWKGALVNTSQNTSNYSSTQSNVGLTDYISYEEVFPPVFGKIYVGSWSYPVTGVTPPTWTNALDVSLAAIGNQQGDVQSANVSISNNTESFFVIGDTTARAIVPQQRKYEGKISMAFENESAHQNFLGEYVNTYTADPTYNITLTNSATFAGTSNPYTVTDGAAVGWTSDLLVGATVTVTTGTFIVTTNSTSVLTMTLVSGTAPGAGSLTYIISNYGTGSWSNPWFVGNRQKYKAMKLLYDNSSLGYSTSSASYRRIEITLLGVKFKTNTLPKQVSGIIYQDFDWQALMLAPYNASDNVGGITVFDGINSTDFHSANPTS